jgi:hypothetical protein
VGGAIPVGDQIAVMQKTGFILVEYLGTSGVATSRFTVGALFRARKAG